MPLPFASTIALSARQRLILERLSRQKSRAHRLVQRAQMILAMSQGASNSQLARQFGLTRVTVCFWRTRWQQWSPCLLEAEAEVEAEAEAEARLLRLIEQALSDSERSGAPPTFSAHQVVGIVALACEEPCDSGRPISHWSAREVAEEAQHRGLVESISVRTVGRFLKAGGAGSAPRQVLAYLAPGG